MYLPKYLLSVAKQLLNIYDTICSFVPFISEMNVQVVGQETTFRETLITFKQN